MIHATYIINMLSKKEAALGLPSLLSMRFIADSNRLWMPLQTSEMWGRCSEYCANWLL